MTPAEMVQKCDILMLVPHLGPGGAQKVVTSVAAAWTHSGRNVVLVTCWSRPEVHNVDSGVQRIHLGFEGYSRNKERGSRIDRLMAKLRWRLGLLQNDEELALLRGMQRWQVGQIQAVIQRSQPQYIVSFLSKTNIMTLIASRGSPARTIISERNDMERQLLEEPWKALRDRLYPRAHLVTANTGGTLGQLAAFVPAHRLKLLPNPVELPPLPSPDNRQKHFMTASRLVPQKAVDVIIKAFAAMAAQAPQWELHVLGDGPERAVLEALAASTGLGKRICFHGHVDPAQHMANAGAYVLASRYEGLPNAMLEAMAFGLPVIASDASPGPLDFVIHGESGLVFRVDDVDDLAAAMLRITRDSAEASAMGAAARRKIEAFAMSQGLEAWDQALLDAAMNQAGK